MTAHEAAEKLNAHQITGGRSWKPLSGGGWGLVHHFSGTILAWNSDSEIIEKGQRLREYLAAEKLTLRHPRRSYHKRNDAWGWSAFRNGERAQKFNKLSAAELIAEAEGLE